MYPIKTAILPSFLLVLMGTIDCITTVIGLLYFGAVELNPLMAAVVGNIPLFLVLKLSATCCIAGTYVLARKILSSASDKTTKSFRYSSTLIKAAYIGLVTFLIATVINNLIVLLA
jgi:hypothetical protein